MRSNVLLVVGLIISIVGCKSELAGNGGGVQPSPGSGLHSPSNAGASETSVARDGITQPADFVQLPSGSIRTVTPFTLFGAEGLVFVNGDVGGAGVYTMNTLDGANWGSYYPVPFYSNNQPLLTTQRVATTPYYGFLSVIMAATDGDLYVNNYSPQTGWTGTAMIPRDAGANFSTTSPAETTLSCNGTLQVLLVVPNLNQGSIDANVYDSKKWLGWSALPRVLPGFTRLPIALVSRGDEVLAYIVAIDGKIFSTAYRCNLGWSGVYREIPDAHTYVDVGAAYDSLSRTVRVIITAQDGGIYYTDSTDGETGWTPYAGPIGYTARAVAAFDFGGRFQAFISNEGLIYENRFTSSAPAPVTPPVAAPAPAADVTAKFSGSWSGILCPNPATRNGIVFNANGTGTVTLTMFCGLNLLACNFKYRAVDANRVYLEPQGENCNYSNLLPAIATYGDDHHFVLTPTDTVRAFSSETFSR